MLTVVEVADFPRRRGGTVSFAARPVDDPRIPPRIRISWYEAPERPQIGDVWQLEVRLRRPRGTSNPGVFDYEAWLFRERIGATGYIVNGSRNQRLEHGAGELAEPSAAAYRRAARRGHPEPGHGCGCCRDLRRRSARHHGRTMAALCAIRDEPSHGDFGTACRPRRDLRLVPGCCRARATATRRQPSQDRLACVARRGRELRLPVGFRRSGTARNINAAGARDRVPLVQGTAAGRDSRRRLFPGNAAAIRSRHSRPAFSCRLRPF